jgi:GNAT superfamily N-acetyltransferase
MHAVTGTMQIREAGEADIPSVLSLYATLETAPSIAPAAAFAPAAALAAMRQYPWHKIFVVTQDERIVATFTLTIIDYLAHQGARTGIMEAVVVDPQLRSQGIGKEMIAFCLDRCREERCYKLALSSNVVRERAHAFYEREGFKLHGYSFAVDL